MSEATDGASHTAIVSEALKSVPDRGAFQPARDVWMGGFRRMEPETLTNAFMLDLCGRAASQPAPYFAFAGWRWMEHDLTQSLYNHVVGPNSATINCADMKQGKNPSPPPDVSYEPSNRGIQKASSGHPGGVNLLMLDGSVRFVSESIDLTIWRAAASCAGGEDVAGL